MMQNKVIQKLVIDISETKKSSDILTKEITDKETEITRLREGMNQKNAEKTQLILNLSFLVRQLRNPQHQQEAGLDTVFIEEDDQGAQIRTDLHDITRALQVVYQLDTLTPLEQIPIVVRNLIHDQTADW